MDSAASTTVSSTAPSHGKRPGGRSARVQSAVFTAVGQLVGSGERETMTIPQVAELGFSTLQIDDGWEVDNAHPQVGIAGGSDSAVAVPMWNVDDIGTAVGRVRDAGGRVITGPDRQAYGNVALCADDQGAQFYLGQLF